VRGKRRIEEGVAHLRRWEGGRHRLLQVEGEEGRERWGRREAMEEEAAAAGERRRRPAGERRKRQRRERGGGG
jgi:hypothetical protein